MPESGPRKYLGKSKAAAAKRKDYLRSAQRAAPRNEKDFDGEYHRIRGDEDEIEAELMMAENQDKFGVWNASEKMKGYIRSRKEESEAVVLDQYIARRYDLKSYTDVQRVLKHWPNYFQRKLEWVDHQASLVKRLARINMLGEQTEEDALFLYAIEMGYITEPRAKFWVALNANEGEQYEEGSYREGFFRPRMGRHILDAMFNNDHKTGGFRDNQEVNYAGEDRRANRLIGQPQIAVGYGGPMAGRPGVARRAAFGLAGGVDLSGADNAAIAAHYT